MPSWRVLAYSSRGPSASLATSDVPDLPRPSRYSADVAGMTTPGATTANTSGAKGNRWWTVLAFGASIALAIAIVLALPLLVPDSARDAFGQRVAVIGVIGVALAGIGAVLMADAHNRPEMGTYDLVGKLFVVGATLFSLTAAMLALKAEIRQRFTDLVITIGLAVIGVCLLILIIRALIGWWRKRRPPTSTPLTPTNSTAPTPTPQTTPVSAPVAPIRGAAPTLAVALSVAIAVALALATTAPQGTRRRRLPLARRRHSDGR
jgi:hypothetical protein